MCVVYDFCFAKPQRTMLLTWSNGSAKPNVVKELRISFIMVSLHISLRSFFVPLFAVSIMREWFLVVVFFPGPYSESRSYSYQNLRTHTRTKICVFPMNFRWCWCCFVFNNVSMWCSDYLYNTDGFYLLLSYFVHKKFIWYNVYVLNGRRDGKKGEINVHFKQKLRNWCSRSEIFGIFLLLFYYPVSVLFFGIFMYTLHYITVKSMSTTLARANDGIAQNDWGRKML